MGANQSGHWGQPQETLLKAIDHLRSHHLQILNVSLGYETAPIGVPGQQTYLNIVIEIHTSLGPLSLLRYIKQIEFSAGRRGSVARWGARVLDIDIIDYKGQIRKWPFERAFDKSLYAHDLILPHAFAHLRPFVLVPLYEIKPKWRHPVLNADIKTMLCRIGINVRNRGEILRKIDYL